MLRNIPGRRALAGLAVAGAISIAAIACGTDNPGGPAAGDNETPGTGAAPTSPPIQQAQDGFDAARVALEANGATVVRASDVAQGLFAFPYTVALVNGESVDFYEFPSTGEAIAATQQVSEDGTIYSQPGQPAIAVDFLELPHLYQQGRVIVVYSGDDHDVTLLLRETFGEEFAGDRGPVEPGSPGDDPGYATVVEPAPIESVQVVEDPDRPGFFNLIVRSGLPNGCASFHDIGAQQTGELELTLSVLNRVPAPGELIACTEQYRIIEHTVPLGSAADNLDACELYTVRWESRGKRDSLSFQVTAPNIRCMQPDQPGTGEDDPVVEPIISDLDVLLLALEAAGVEVIKLDRDQAELFGFPSEAFSVNGERVDIYSFSSVDRARLAASGVAVDGFSLSLGINGPEVQISWISTPHFYLSGRSIVLYVGDNEEILSGLEPVGPKFAGPGAEPVEPPTDPREPLPLPPESETVLIPAQIVSVGEVVIAESFPPQYFVQVRSAQPNGCERDAGWEVEIIGNDVHVTVLNTQPADLSVVLCAAIYGETVHNVRLGSGEFEPGAEYNLLVNEKSFGTFRAQ